LIGSLRLKSGQLLVEVLISITLVAILIAALIPLILSTTSASTKENKNTVASLLAKEQIEAAQALKEEDWNKIYFPLDTSNKGATNPYHLVLSAGKWQLAAGIETVNLNGIDYQKSIRIENISRTGPNGAGDIGGTNDDPSTQKITATVADFGALPINIVEYFTRFKSQTWTQTDWQGGAGYASWQDPPGNRYFSGTNVDTTTLVGAVQLAKSGGGGTGTYGNRFLLTSTSSIGSMNRNNYRSAMRFRAQKDGSVSSVRVYIQTATNSGGITYRYGLQADNAGNPSGTYLSSGTAAFSTTGWQTVNLASPVSVTAGTTYHLVIQYVSGTINNTHYIAIRNSQPLNQLVPFNQAADNQQNTLWFNGSAWSVQNREPLYVLGFSDGTFEGNPYDNSEARSIYEGNFEGEKFTLAADKTVSALNIYVSKNTNQNPADSLKVTLQDLTANTKPIDNLVFLSGPDVTTTYAWKTLNLPSSLTLPAGNQFRLYFSSSGSDSKRYYRLYNVSNPNNAEYNGINWEGTGSVVSRSINSGAIWSEIDYIDLSGYYFSTVEPSSYAPNGELVSSTYDMGARAGFNRIWWTNVSLPANTIIKFQLAANNDLISPWNFVGPQGTDSDYYTLSSGENIWSGLANNRYLRYKLFLSTGNSAITPVLGEVKINLSP